jgi:hypothetical protein
LYHSDHFPFYQVIGSQEKPTGGDEQDKTVAEHTHETLFSASSGCFSNRVLDPVALSYLKVPQL